MTAIIFILFCLFLSGFSKLVFFIIKFRTQFFCLEFYNLPMKSLEASEKLEQLRYLEFGKRIKMVETADKSIGIDTPEDLDKARKMV